VSELTPELSGVLLGAMVLYIAVLFGIAWWARGRIHTTDDYFVAGRQLSLGLSTATLFATWFGAGTLLAATDEVRREGVRAAALDPWGAGVCLLLAGFFLAARLWRMELLSLPDYFGRRFGARAELLSAILLVPGYFGWIAAQFVALAGMLQLFFGLDLWMGILLVSAIGTGYTLIGGMWSVTLTDALQMALLCVGLAALLVAVSSELGGPVAGVERILRETPEAMLQPIPLDDTKSLLGWLALFCAGSLGNLPSQELMQRMFSARSAAVARMSCLMAGFGYLLIGCGPILLGLASNLLLPDQADRAILPALSALFLDPWLAVVFVITIMSAVLSTIDSAILAPASVVARNLMPKRALTAPQALRRDRLAVVFVAAASVAAALFGEDAYSLLESAYEIGLVSLLVPVVLGLATPRGGEPSSLAAMGLGTGLWLVHVGAGWEWLAEPWLAPDLTLPVGLSCAAIAAAAYAAVLLVDRLRRGPRRLRSTDSG
jgi:SSS family solute:Na+ symporter